MGESQSNGLIERTVGLEAAQAKKLKVARIIASAPGSREMRGYSVGWWSSPRRCDFAGTELRRDTGCMNEGTIHRSLNLGEKGLLHARQSSESRKAGTAMPSWYIRCSSSKVVVVTEQGLAINRAANIRRIPESERRDADRTLGMRAVLWSPDGSDNACDIQVGNGEARGDGAPFPSRRADGEQCSKGVPS